MGLWRKSGSETRCGTGTESGTGSGTGTESGTGTGLGTGTGTGSESGFESGFESGPDWFVLGVCFEQLVKCADADLHAQWLLTAGVHVSNSQQQSATVSSADAHICPAANQKPRFTYSAHASFGGPALMDASMS